ncbi:MAG: DUF4271 domain-containing protein [Chitinophagaceae bacterium]
MKKILSVLWCCLISVVVFAQSETDSSVQQKDTTPIQDTTVKKPVITPDSAVRPVKRKPVIVDSAALQRARDSAAARLQDSIAPIRSEAVSPVVPRHYSIAAFQRVLKDHPYFDFFGTPLNSRMVEKKVNDKDALFYFLLGLTLYIGLVKLLFDKYLSNVITLFFRATLRQQQIREQLLQAPLPSLLLNIFFLLTGGLFLTFVLKRYNVAPEGINFWLLVLYSMGLLLAIYLGKFLLLKITGWIFNVSHATDTYIFIVFLVNKIIGIFLLPVVVLLAFPYPALYQVVFTLSFVILVVFYIYRFIISYKPVRNEIKVSRLHFFVYLCAFEIAPLLLIYKVLLIFVERSY